MEIDRNSETIQTLSHGDVIQGMSTDGKLLKLEVPCTGWVDMIGIGGNPIVVILCLNMIH